MEITAARFNQELTPIGTRKEYAGGPEWKKVVIVADTADRVHTGKYEITLIVNDGVLDSAPATATVEVEELVPPIAVIDPPRQKVRQNQGFSLEGGKEGDPEATLTYRWTMLRTS